MEYDTEQTTIRMIQKQTIFKDKTVLEIGCGGGKLSSLLADETKVYIGIDPNGDAIREAKENYDNADFRIGDGESLVFRDSLFDLVLFTLSLHHQNSTAALKEAYRVLKNNGKLVIVEPSVEGEFQQFFHLFNDETREIQKAYHSLLNSAFTLEDKDSFDAFVRFEEETDLCRYDFDREKVTPRDENRIMNKIEELQPGASNLSPIILKDTLDIYLLTKV